MTNERKRPTDPTQHDEEQIPATLPDGWRKREKVAEERARVARIERRSGTHSIKRIDPQRTSSSVVA